MGLSHVTAKAAGWQQETSIVMRRRSLQRNSFERQEAAYGVFAYVIGQAPGGTVIEEFQARFGAGGEARIGLDAAFKLGLEGRIFSEVFASQFLEHVRLAVFALFED